MGDFRWLHFSDLHLETKLPECNSGTARDELIHTLQNEDFGNREELYVFITGDIANKASYTDGQDLWIEKFKVAIGVPQDRIFWAPGNHDIKRIIMFDYAIKGLRDGDFSDLDSFRNKASCQKGDNTYELLTVDRMSDYQKKYNTFFGRKLTERQLKEIHQLYEFKDFNLVVLNTSITSMDDNDQGKLLLKSEEFRQKIAEGGESSADKPFFVIGHHGLEFLKLGDADYARQRFASENVDVYLCGHAHRPNIGEVTGRRPEIKQITCGGGTPEYGCQLTFFYGKYDSARKGIHLEPYVYGYNTRWEKDYRVIDVDKNNFFPFPRLDKCADISCSQEKKQKDRSMPYIAWNIDRLAWQMPREWEPNVDAIVPLDDRNALSLPVLLLGNREGYITLLATTLPRGMAVLLQQRERKYSDTYKAWKERSWCECEGTEFVDDGGAEEDAGLVICVKAERLVKESLWEVIRRWRDERPQRAVIVNVWSESPYYAVRCAQLVYRYISNAGALARAFVAAELGEEKALKPEERKVLNQWVDALEKKVWNSDGENEEVRELQEFRDERPDKWVALLKCHAKRRKIPGWICGYRASFRIHEFVSQWLEAADNDKFFLDDELSPYISRLKEEEMDTLIWEVFQLSKKSHTDPREYLLKQLSEMGSESIRTLIRIWDSEDEKENFRQLEYSEIARWGRACDRERFERAMEHACKDKVRSWVLIMSSPNAMDAVAERLMDPSLRKEAELILSQDVDLETDLELYEEICFIRQKVYREIYTEEGNDL